MDMVKDNANRVRLNYDGMLSFYEVNLSAYWHDINHTMDNYSLRPATGMRMEASRTCSTKTTTITWRDNPRE